MIRTALVAGLFALPLSGCPTDRAPVTPVEDPTPERRGRALPKSATVPAPIAPKVETKPTAHAAVRFLVRNKQGQGLDLASARLPQRLTAAQLAQAPGGLELVVGETRVVIAVGASLSSYARFLLGSLGALDADLRADLKSFLPPQTFMGLKAVVGAAFQKDQSLLVLQTGEDAETLRFSYLTPLGQAPGAPYVKELEVSRAAWIAAATQALDAYFTKSESAAAPKTRSVADGQARNLLGLWHQVGWKLKLS